MKPLFALTFAAVTAFALPSQAGPIVDGVYKIQNNTYHSLGDAGFYRKNPTGGHTLYDFNSNGADVNLTYDSGAGVIKLSGQAYDTAEKRLVDFDLNYTQVTRDDGKVISGEMNLIGTFDGVEVMGKTNRAGASLDLTPTSPLDKTLFAPLKGHAWLGTEDGHFGDFHFTGTRFGRLPSSTSSSGGGAVPVPGGIAFLIVGALALRRMKKRNA